MKYPKCKNPLTNTYFRRGDPYPFIEGHRIFGDESKKGLFFKQYNTKSRHPTAGEFAYMHFVTSETLELNRVQNALGMRRLAQNLSVEQRIWKHARKLHKKQHGNAKPINTVTEIYDCLLKDWKEALKARLSSDYVRICPITEENMYLSSSGAHYDNYASVHRFDNEVGYRPGNIGWISYRANRLISNASLFELQKLVSNLKKQILKKMG